MMWTLQKIFYRSFHALISIIVKRINMPVPTLSSGPGSIRELPALIQSNSVQHVLVVTDKGITSIGLMDGLLAALQQTGIRYTLFDDVQPNPTIDNIEAGVMLYQAQQCDGLVAFGGGSPMDCAKMIGARISHPDKTVQGLRGVFKVSHDLPPLFAVPTTAGTGSECSLGAMVSDPARQEKFGIGSLRMVPPYAVLDAELMTGLPAHITATTGMDALTHAIEAYIGRWGSSYTDAHAEKAVRIIFEDLEAVYQNGNDVTRRHNLALASHYAGLAFTRAMVGYVHAISHNLGGMYGVAHGLANAIVLPHVLEFSKVQCETKLARLAIVGGIGEQGESTDNLCDRFIDRIRTMNRNMDIPTTIAELREQDIPQLAQQAVAEGNPGYPVPRLMNQTQCEALLRELLPPTD